MQSISLGAGLAAFAFWMFIAVAVVAGIWDGIRKREARHETIRRLVESGQPIDKHVIDKLLLMNKAGSDRPDRDFLVTAMWIGPVSLGVAVLAQILGMAVPEARIPLLGAAALLAVLSVGYYLASKVVAHKFPFEGESEPDLM